MKHYWIATLAALILLTGCGAKAASAPSYEMVMEENIAPVMEMPAAAEPMDSAAGRGVSSSVEATQQERLVIKNANLSITVDDPEERIKAITRLASSLGGHVVSSNIYQTYANNGVQIPEGEITIRVPSESLDDALERIKAGVVEVNSENVSGEDVTDKYVDLQSRLRAKEAAEEKLLEIMDQAYSTEDVLSVYAQLQMIQSDIEVLTGQINFYERSAALSSIRVSVIADEKSQPIEIGGWKLGATANAAVQDLIDYMQGFIQFLIRFIILILPVLLTFFLPLYLVFLGLRAIVHRNRMNKAAKVQPEEK